MQRNLQWKLGRLKYYKWKRHKSLVKPVIFLVARLKKTKHCRHCSAAVMHDKTITLKGTAPVYDFRDDRLCLRNGSINASLPESAHWRQGRTEEHSTSVRACEQHERLCCVLPCVSLCLECMLSGNNESVPTCPVFCIVVSISAFVMMLR